MPLARATVTATGECTQQEAQTAAFHRAPPPRRKPRHRLIPAHHSSLISHIIAPLCCVCRACPPNLHQPPLTTHHHHHHHHHRQRRRSPPPCPHEALHDATSAVPCPQQGRRATRIGVSCLPCTCPPPPLPSRPRLPLRSAFRPPVPEAVSRRSRAVLSRPLEELHTHHAVCTSQLKPGTIHLPRHRPAENSLDRKSVV